MRRIIWLAAVLWAVPVLAIAGQGEVSIDAVSTWVNDYAIRADMPARFVIRINNTTGEKCDLSIGFKVSSPDGAIWYSTLIDSAGPNVNFENAFIKYFDIVYANWSGPTMGGDGTNPDTVGILGAGMPSKTTKRLPVDYNDTSLAIVIDLHDNLSVGKQICIDSCFWGVGGTWRWVGASLTDYTPTFTGLPGQPYSDGEFERFGSGYCFTLVSGTPPDSGDVIRVPADYATIQEAINAASEGDSILVSPGSYSGPLALSGKSVTLVSTHGPKVTTITGPDNTNLMTISGPATSASIIEGFRFNGGLSAIWCRDAGPMIRRNLFIQQRQGDWAAIALGGETGYVGNSPARIINNTIVGCFGGGISSFSTSAPTIMNNIIAGNEKYGIHIDGGRPNDVSFNDVYASPVLYYNVSEPGPGHMNANPILNPITWELQEGSPCINAGNPDSMYADPNGSRNDMGAIPFGGDVEPPLIDTLLVPGEFASIQQAIDASSNSNLILVSPGQYGPFNFNGKLVTVRSTDGPLATVITSMTTSFGDAAIPSALVTFNHGENSSALLEGFTLQGGWIGVLCLGAGPTIRGNLLVGQFVNNWAAISIAGPNFEFNATEGPAPAVIVNNTIVGSSNGGISTFSTAAPTIKNNIIAFNDAYGIHKQRESLPLDISYNDIFGNPIPAHNIVDLGLGARAEDPLLNPNKTLMQGSPCINTGDPDPIYNDADGSRNDMGAIPYGGDLPPIALLNLMQWRVEDGGNDHWYAVLPQKHYWVEADQLAKTFAKDGMTGYLATIGSPQENQFITDQVLVGADQDNRFDNFFIGARDIGLVWQWITGEPFTYTNWADFEPNNVGIETALAMYGHYDTYSYATPGTWNNTLPDGTVNQLHRYWSVVEFGPIDTTSISGPYPTNEWISLYCNLPTLDNIPLAPGTIITAYDPQGVLCGKAVVKPDGSYGFLLVYRDDQYTDFDEGAERGDKLSFKINNEPATVTPPVFWGNNGDQIQACAFERNACITLNLHEGWNLVSWNVIYSGATRNLFAPIVDAVDFVLSFDQGGLVWDPDLERYSTLMNVDFHHGYWVKMHRDAVLEVCGDPMPPTEAIPVYRGWNLVSYLPDQYLNPPSALATISNDLEVAVGYDMGAKIFLPDNPAFNTLTHMRPGLGYWLRMREAAILDYFFMPLAAEDHEGSLAGAAISDEPLGSRVWMSLYGEKITLDDQPLAESSRLEVYSVENQLLGSGIYSRELLRFVPVYGADGDEASAKYATMNEELTLKVNGVEMTEKIVWTGDGTVYRLEALTSGSLPTAFALGQNYPNPFNPATTITFSLPHRDKVRLSVYNLLGQEISVLADGVYDAGTHNVTWNGRDSGDDQVPTGLYFYRLESTGVTLTRKMMLLK
ncbi:MAG: right-handed parallel beta-helix repeat-containing protein [candidate division Zixibacteria bacterium]|nr:right-handed parallel beta-helix repeat-containing protein [candidate division Zixibacteria bacterium]